MNIVFIPYELQTTMPAILWKLKFCLFVVVISIVYLYCVFGCTLQIVCVSVFKYKIKLIFRCCCYFFPRYCCWFQMQAKTEKLFNRTNTMSIYWMHWMLLFSLSFSPSLSPVMTGRQHWNTFNYFNRWKLEIFIRSILVTHILTLVANWILFWIRLKFQIIFFHSEFYIL